MMKSPKFGQLRSFGSSKFNAQSVLREGASIKQGNSNIGVSFALQAKPWRLYFLLPFPISLSPVQRTS